MCETNIEEKRSYGLIAIHFGNPKFNGRAVILELSFITLSVLVLWKRYSKALYACSPLSPLVIIGNSLVPHTYMFIS
jgi:hypothetical protein